MEGEWGGSGILWYNIYRGAPIRNFINVTQGSCPYRPTQVKALDTQFFQYIAL